MKWGATMTNNEAKKWGLLIKYQRQQKGLKQDDVAVGICTTSYLSRIENCHCRKDCL